MPIAYITHAKCLRHDVGQDHPEQPARLHAINDRLISSGLEFVIQQHDAPMATREQLERVHNPSYVAEIFAKAPSEGIVMLDSDTFMMPATLEAALYAAGAVILAVDLMMAKKVSAAFCAVRPPGHHAERGSAMGFCYFNNVAVGAAHALAAHGLERVAIVDFDVHHGNGTEDIFRDDARVMFCSSFQHPYYPFTGHETAPGHIINIPLSAGTDGQEFRKQVEVHWLSALDDFRPQMIFISAGFDAHAQDPMGQLRLREPDYAWITQALREIALKHAEGRIVSVLEGGYDLPSLARSVVTHIDALLGH